MRCFLLDEMVSTYQTNHSNFEVSDQNAEDYLQYIIFCLKEYLPNLKNRMLSVAKEATVSSQGTSGQHSPRTATRAEKQVKKEVSYFRI